MVQPKKCLPRDSSAQQTTSHHHNTLFAQLPIIGMVMVLVFGPVYAIQGVEGAGGPAFTQDCSGFAQDSVLSGLWPMAPGEQQSSTALAAMVPHLAMQGTALATYAPQREAQAGSTLEGLFGVAQEGQREIVETTFSQETRAVVLFPNVLATVAHALTVDTVEVKVGQRASIYTIPLRVTSMAVTAHTAPTAEGVPAQVAHINEPYDLALIQSPDRSILQPLPYPAALSYGTGDPRQPSGGLQAGDCVAAVVASRHEKTHGIGGDRLVIGKVLARVPVATNSMTQTKLNVNMFTTDLAVQPGDSGSPVLALHAGKPVLVGLVSATMYPTVTFTYVSRIDPILALADALRSAGARHQKQTLLWQKDQVGPEEQ
jgi:hypothetical protein